MLSKIKKRYQSFSKLELGILYFIIICFLGFICQNIFSQSKISKVKVHLNSFLNERDSSEDTKGIYFDYLRGFKKDNYENETSYYYTKHDNQKIFLEVSSNATDTYTIENIKTGKITNMIITSIILCVILWIVFIIALKLDSYISRKDIQSPLFICKFPKKSIINFVFIIYLFLFTYQLALTLEAIVFFFIV
jgi:cell division protein FtsL